MIEVYDNFFSQEIQHQIYTFLMNTGGWTLTGGDPTKNRFWHFENLEQINYFNDFLYKKIIDKLNKKIDSFERIYANGQTSGQCGTLHIDDGDSTFLYYPNPEWKTDYQGHLIFFNGDEEDSEACRIVEYKPNRAIFFDGKIPHYADAPDRCYNDLRISLAYKLKHSTI
jgi:hypothetical protein|tara:strand:- start:56 stop:562 length:507 start_codon:yes stop_codon:yes gene_type:complete